MGGGGLDGAAGAAGGAPGTVGRGMAVMSVPHFSQNFASSSLRAPQRLQYIVSHLRSMLPVVDVSVTSNCIAAARYVAWSGA